MNKVQAAREAKSLIAEWAQHWRKTDTAWRDVYEPGPDLARVDAALDELEARLAEQGGPSLFFRLSLEETAARTARNSEWPPFRAAAGEQ